jgi:adenine-specific DNA-methyltransferase
MRVKHDTNLGLRNFARQLCKSSTDAEAKLWSILRSRKLAGYKFRRQYPIAGFIVDFHCAQERLAVELDGGQHGDPAAVEYDAKRTITLVEMGVSVVRYANHDVLRTSDEIAEDIYRQLTVGMPSPQPSPGLPGEGARTARRVLGLGEGR